MAHQLALLSFDDFLLFDPNLVKLPMRSLGPVAGAKGNAARAVARHIKRLNPKAKIRVRGEFVAARHANLLQGVVIGGMSSIESCIGAASAAKTRGLPFLTIGLPSQRGARIVLGSTARTLTPAHFGAAQVTKDDLLVITARAAASLNRE